MPRKKKKPSTVPVVTNPATASSAVETKSASASETKALINSLPREVIAALQQQLGRNADGIVNIGGREVPIRSVLNRQLGPVGPDEKEVVIRRPEEKSMSGDQQKQFYLEGFNAEADIFKAVINNDIASVQKYLQNGGDVNIPTIFTETSSSLIQVAAIFGYKPIVELLLDKSSDQHRGSALVEAVANSQNEMVKFLVGLEKYRDRMINHFSPIATDGGLALATPLMVAISNSNDELIKLLLPLSDVNLRNKKEESAISASMICRNPAIFSEVLNHHAINFDFVINYLFATKRQKANYQYLLESVLQKAATFDLGKLLKHAKKASSFAFAIGEHDFLLIPLNEIILKKLRDTHVDQITADDFHHLNLYILNIQERELAFQLLLEQAINIAKKMTLDMLVMALPRLMTRGYDAYLGVLAKQLHDVVTVRLQEINIDLLPLTLMGPLLVLSSHLGLEELTTNILAKHPDQINATYNVLSFEERVEVYAVTPLMAAAMNGHVQIVTLLLNHNADVNKETAWSALTFAYTRKQEQVLKILVARPEIHFYIILKTYLIAEKISPNSNPQLFELVKNSLYKAPIEELIAYLTMSLFSHHSVVFEICLDRIKEKLKDIQDPDTLEVMHEDLADLFFLYLSRPKAQEKPLKALLESVVSVNSPHLKIDGGNQIASTSFLNHLVSYFHVTSITSERIKKVKFLLENGADITHRERIDMKRKRNKSKVVVGARATFLSPEGVAPQRRDDQDEKASALQKSVSFAHTMPGIGFVSHSILMKACETDSIALVKLLLTHAESIGKLSEVLNDITLDGWTPLMFAVKSGQHVIAQELIEKGANLFTENNYRQTVLTIAQEKNDPSLIKLIQTAQGKAWLNFHLKPSAKTSPLSSKHQKKKKKTSDHLGKDNYKKLNELLSEHLLKLQWKIDAQGNLIIQVKNSDYFKSIKSHVAQFTLTKASLELLLKKAQMPRSGNIAAVGEMLWHASTEYQSSLKEREKKEDKINRSAKEDYEFVKSYADISKASIDGYYKAFQDLVEEKAEAVQDQKPVFEKLYQAANNIKFVESDTLQQLTENAQELMRLEQVLKDEFTKIDEKLQQDKAIKEQQHRISQSYLTAQPAQASAKKRAVIDDVEGDAKATSTPMVMLAATEKMGSLPVTENISSSLENKESKIEVVFRGNSQPKADLPPATLKAASTQGFFSEWRESLEHKIPEHDRKRYKSLAAAEIDIRRIQKYFHILFKLLKMSSFRSTAEQTSFMCDVLIANITEFVENSKRLSYAVNQITPESARKIRNAILINHGFTLLQPQDGQFDADAKLLKSLKDTIKKHWLSSEKDSESKTQSDFFAKAERYAQTHLTVTQNKFPLNICISQLRQAILRLIQHKEAVQSLKTPSVEGYFPIIDLAAEMADRLVYQQLYKYIKSFSAEELDEDIRTILTSRGKMEYCAEIISKVKIAHEKGRDLRHGRVPLPALAGPLVQTRLARPLEQQATLASNPLMQSQSLSVGSDYLTFGKSSRNAQSVAKAASRTTQHEPVSQRRP